MQPLVVPARANGPARSGNGGWTAGALAAALPQAAAGWAVAVRLHAPPPLETPLAVTREPDGSVTARDQAGATVASARPVDPAAAFEPEPPPAASWDEALAAATSYGGLVEHPFPTCFVCGTERTPEDGLCLRPGQVGPEPGRTAAAWVPHASLAGPDGRVTAAVTWSALDCPSGWTVDLVGRPMVLGTITAAVAERPVPGERYVVDGRFLRREGRRVWTESALRGVDGRLLARAAAVWVEVDPAAFQALRG